MSRYYTPLVRIAMALALASCWTGPVTSASDSTKSTRSRRIVVRLARAEEVPKAPQFGSWDNMNRFGNVCPMVGTPAPELRNAILAFAHTLEHEVSSYTGMPYPVQVRDDIRSQVGHLELYQQEPGWGGGIFYCVRVRKTDAEVEVVLTEYQRAMG